MDLNDPAEHVRRNRTDWAEWSAAYRERAPAAWANREIVWGVWKIPERRLNVLGDVKDRDVLELGCGTAYFSARLARAGANAVGVDISPEQLETARAMQREHDLHFQLIEANAEHVPLPDDSFDIVFSEYGASIWCDPEGWVPEAARLLRPGGLLAFLVNGTILTLCWPHDGYAGTTLVRPYFGLYRQEDPDDGSVNFHLPYGAWVRLLRANRLEIEDLIELQAPDDAAEHPLMQITPEWGRHWPADEIWKARKAR